MKRVKGAKGVKKSAPAPQTLDGPASGRPRPVVPLAILALIALLLFWRLDAVYLWQDEANTAVLAARMLEFGKPLAYDGVNLLTNDNFAAEDQTTIDKRAGNAAAGVAYIVGRGDLRPDTAWVFQPWGQFVMAAASIKLLGQTTLAARLPFALAAFAGACLFAWLVFKSTQNRRITAVALALLAMNSGWILHGRQARYYALSSVFLLLTVSAYDRWQRQHRAGAPVFVAIAWCWFQVDYGTFWPVVGVLFLHAWLIERRRVVPLAITGGALLATVTPFIVFYQLGGRLSTQQGSWSQRFQHNLFYLDQQVIAIVVLLAALFVLRRRARALDEAERRLVTVSLLVLGALLLWVPTVAPEIVLRYLVMAAPLACFVTAWTIVRGLPAAQPATVWAVAAFLATTPWLSTPFTGLAPIPQLSAGAATVRPGLSAMLREVFIPRKDVNRAVVEWLRHEAAPADEILVNYEDAPLMYYLPNPIRGGVAAFRADDDTKGPPRFVVLRRSVLFVHWRVFNRARARYALEEVALDAPDVVWGNNPDPVGRIQDPDAIRNLFVARVRGFAQPTIK